MKTFTKWLENFADEIRARLIAQGLDPDGDPNKTIDNQNLYHASLRRKPEPSPETDRSGIQFQINDLIRRYHSSKLPREREELLRKIRSFDPTFKTD